jgi:hypothetical protein
MTDDKTLAQPTLRGLRNAAPAPGLPDLAPYVDNIHAAAVAQSQALATAAKIPFAAAQSTLLAAYFIVAKGVAPTTADMDARTAKWRVRIRLYDMRDQNEVQADTDPDLPPGHDGAMVRHGLPGVAEWLMEVATDYHGEQCGGLDMNTLRHRLKGLRPTLSRRGGNAVWRVPYVCSRGEWSARCDVVRVNE